MSDWRKQCCSHSNAMVHNHSMGHVFCQLPRVRTILRDTNQKLACIARTLVREPSKSDRVVLKARLLQIKTCVG